MSNSKWHQVIVGDSRDVLTEVDSESVQAVITSPPYWGFREASVDGEIGGELELCDYIDGLEGVFSQVYRVLRKDGVIWVNIGDVYSSGHRTYRASDRRYRARGSRFRPRDPVGIGPKNLIGVPWRFAFRLQEIGFHLRSEIIWYKRNGMPESVKDRPIRRHEHLFLLSKSKDYFFDYNFLRGDFVDGRGTVWDVPMRPSSIRSHSETFPEELVSPCILSSSKRGQKILDPFAGSLTTGRVAKRLGRRFMGIEINEVHVSEACSDGSMNWMQLTRPIGASVLKGGAGSIVS